MAEVLHNPTPEELRSFTEAMPECRVSEHGNVNVQTQVLVENGGTVVLGGIYEQTERTTTTKVPLLGDIPVLGWLFRNRTRVNDRTELMIFITPRVISERVAAAVR